jgi:ketosteroid isomerase-like protein
MKYIFSFLFLILFFTSCQKPEKEVSETDEEAIAAVEEVVQNLFDEVWARYDANAIKKYQTEDFLLLEHGELWNNDSIATWCKNAKTRLQNTKRTNSFERIEARRNANKLWLAYHNYGTFKNDTTTYKKAWLESVVAVKKDSIWKLELMHSTRQPAE